MFTSRSTCPLSMKTRQQTSDVTLCCHSVGVSRSASEKTSRRARSARLTRRPLPRAPRLPGPRAGRDGADRGKRRRRLPARPGGGRPVCVAVPRRPEPTPAGRGRGRGGGVGRSRRGARREAPAWSVGTVCRRPVPSVAGRPPLAVGRAPTAVIDELFFPFVFDGGRGFVRAS